MYRYFWACTYCILITCILSVVTPVSHAALISFPGAEGFGRFATGGRGGDICIVTNTNDSGSGSFRSCAERSGKRIIIFKTGGRIHLHSRVTFSHGDVTVFGQTAPGDGIAITGNELRFYGDNTIVRNLRVYPGDPEGTPHNWDVIKLYGDNAIFDHLTLAWGSDENFQIWTKDQGPVENVTIQWSIITEGLNDPSFNTKGTHGYGLLLAPASHNFSMHHNIFTYNIGRSPLIYGAGRTEFINNSADDYMDFSAEKHLFNIINNHTTRGIRLDSAGSGNKAYISGNSSNKITPIPWGSGNTSFQVQSPAFTGSGITTHSAAEANRLNAQYAGAIIPKKDSITTRSANRSGKLINRMSEVGGFPSYARGTYPTDSDNDGIPDDWERDNGLNPNNARDASEYSNRGYMWIEEYANSLIPMYGFTTDAGLKTHTSTHTTSANQTDTDNRYVPTTPDNFEVWCHLFTASTQMPPTGFGVAYLPFTTEKELLIYAYCDRGSTSRIGINTEHNPPGIQYVWHKGYLATADGSWEEVTLSGDAVSPASGWLNGEHGVGYILNTSEEEQKKAHVFLTYICSWYENEWKCGCRDGNCTQSMWQLQAFKLE